MSITKKTILLVEDEHSIREMVKTLLEIEGYEVFCASNGDEGLVILESIEKTDLILLDLTMPLLSGWSFFELLKKNARYCEIPVIVVSGLDQKASAVVPDAYLTKPIELNCLLTTIHENLL